MDILNYFRKAIKKEASDLHLVAGSAPVLRIKGNLVKIEEESLSNKDLLNQIIKIIPREQIEKLTKNKELDISFKIDDRHFRVNLHFQERKLGVAARLMPQKPPKPEEINLDEVIYRLTHLNDGLILVTGPAGVGKSTTLATMIDVINQERRAHIITIEDPIEYRFQDKQSLIEQRELNFDTNSFAEALKYSLRQDPNVIMVGEMRDKETMSTALQASETGHLVLSTLHTPTAKETISRIINIFPPDNHQMILNQLSTCLRAVISQQLLPSTRGGRVVAREILVNNSAISSLIRNNKLEQIYNAIETGAKDGMITMNRAIENLYHEGIIDKKTATSKTRDLSTSATYY